MKAKKHIGFAVAAVLGAVMVIPVSADAAYINVSAGPSSTSISGGDFEYSFTSNGANTNLNHGGSVYTAAIGTTLSFVGKLVDRGATAASSIQVFVLPYAGAKYAVADLAVSNTASSSTNPYSSSYSLSGVYRSGETVLIPEGARTIVAGDRFEFGTPYASNTLFTTAVPEPASMLLLASGVGAAIVARRRRTDRDDPEQGGTDAAPRS